MILNPVPKNYKKYEIAATPGRNGFTSARLLGEANDYGARIITIAEYHELSKVMAAADSYAKIRSSNPRLLNSELARQYEPIISSDLYQNFSLASPVLASPFVIVPKHGQKLERNFVFIEPRSGNEHVFEGIPEKYWGDSGCILAIQHNYIPSGKHSIPTIISREENSWGKHGKTRTVYNVVYPEQQIVAFLNVRYPDELFCQCNQFGLPLGEISSKNEPAAKRFAMSTVGPYIGFTLVSSERPRTVDVAPDATEQYGAILSV
ncbi:Uncharacterised protein [uncultured archaeon]|nr:Uncharacterised protein [uncultured archaeon]